MTKKMITARIPVSVNEQLELLARREKRSKSFLIEEALAIYVAREEMINAKMDASFKQAEESGEWVSNEAVMRWMDSWGTENELSPPKPDIMRKKAAA
jgi:RHH-type transcriptional regulator, rel operon repressor / antitoxin RelB